jgi:hypothetical protein
VLVALSPVTDGRSVDYVLALSFEALGGREGWLRDTEIYNGGFVGAGFTVFSQFFTV